MTFLAQAGAFRGKIYFNPLTGLYFYRKRDYYPEGWVMNQSALWRGQGNRMGKKILIVEDNELNMKLFCDLLEAHDYETIQTRDGMAALDLAREHNPDLILMDIQLPEVSGLEVTKWLKEDEDLRKIPVVAVTAFAMKGDEEKIREGGCEAYIAKPISVGHFLETVKQFVG